MDDFFASGHVGVMLLAMLALEASALMLLWWRWRVGVAPAPLLTFLGAGGCMAMALRAALLGQHGGVALWLVAALPLHLAWLFLAWRRR